MFTRKQCWRRQKSARGRKGEHVKPPLTMFAEGGELFASSQPIMVKSFSSDSSAAQGITMNRTPAMRRTVSDMMVTSRRTLFHNTQPTPTQEARVSVTVGGARPQNVKARSPSTSPASLARRPKGVAFLPQVQVRLIPTAKELPASEKAYLWYSKADLRNFQMDLIAMLPSGANLKANVLSLESVIIDGETINEAQQQEFQRLPTAAIAIPAPINQLAGRDSPVVTVIENKAGEISQEAWAVPKAARLSYSPSSCDQMNRNAPRVQHRLIVA